MHHLHAVRRWAGGEPAMLGDEHTELRWFEVEDACRLEGLAFDAYREVFRRLAPA